MKRIILTIMVLAAAASANAQEAFKHLGAGLEVGTTGAGVQLALPVVTDHITVKLGYNFPNIKYTYETSMDISSINQTINDVNSEIAQAGGTDFITTQFNNNLNLEAPLSVNLGAFKAMFEYYPWAKSSFHFVLGAYFGNADFLHADAYTDASFWSSYKSLISEVNSVNQKYQSVPGYTAYTVKEIKGNVNGTTFAVSEKDGRGQIDAGLAVMQARPYFGIGFGRSVPNHRVSAQFDLGAWYHGTPSLSSNATYDPNAGSMDVDMSTIENVKFFPQVSLGLVVRLF